MRKLKEIARLRFEAGRTLREIAGAVGVARSTVQLTLQRLASAGLSWPWPEPVDEAALEQSLFASSQAVVVVDATPTPDFDQVLSQLGRKGVTRRLLWLEYREQHTDGLGYSQFCELYRRWGKTQDVVLRLQHAPGDKLFVDYAGLTMPVIDPRTGELRPAQVFVAALGHSSYTFIEATWTQTIADWLGSHRRALEFFGGVPAAVVPDNLKSGVLRAHRYNPDINPSYQDLATHYGFAVLPARAATPRDKAAVESAVLVVERAVLAPLRDRQVFSLGELNDAMRPLLADLNARAFQKRQDSRQIVFETVERAALSPLPAMPYEHAIWKKSKVHLDYHIELDRRYYSVPHALVGKTVDVRITERTVEVLHGGQRVAAHMKGTYKGQFTTDPQHRPAGHQAVIELTHERLLQRAEAIGEATAAVLRGQSDRRKHRDETLRSSLGILRLAKDFTPEALEVACRRALHHRTLSYSAILALLKAPPVQAALPIPAITHDNLRGPDYYAETSSC
jgi:transposase